MIIPSYAVHGYAVADGSLIYVFETKVVDNEFVAYHIYVIHFYFITHERLFWVE
jgi:hypothetical protein